MPEYDEFMVEYHCKTCSGQTTHIVHYKLDQKVVIILSRCLQCREIKKRGATILALVRLAAKHQWGEE